MHEVANEANIGEGYDFIREVEVFVEKETPCQTLTSACVTSKFRDSPLNSFLLSRTMKNCFSENVEARKGSCHDLRRLRKRVHEVANEHVGKRSLLWQISKYASRLLQRAECKILGHHNHRRRLSSLPDCTIPSERFYKLKENCSLVEEIVVENEKKLVIVGINAPTIDREETDGRHFHVTNGGYLNITGVTLANGKVKGGNVGYCVCVLL